MKALKSLQLIAIGLLIGLSSGLMAQELTNGSAGTIENESTGTIRFLDDTGKFRNANATFTDIVNDGTIEFQGTDGEFVDDATGNPDQGNALGQLGSRVGGTVLYSGTGGGQTIQDNVYLTNLSLDGAATKAVNNTFVSAVYSINYGSTGTRTYTGTFTYDGTDQDIAWENGTSGTDDRYDVLDLQGTGTKTVPNNATDGEVYVANNLVMADANTLLQVDDDMSVNMVGGTGTTIDGTITVGATDAGSFTQNLGDMVYTTQLSVDNGTFTVADVGTALFNGGATVADASSFIVSDNAGDVTLESSLTLATGATGGILDMGASTTLNVNSAGSLVNSFAARTNTTYDITSTVAFDDTQAVPSTVLSNPYGLLDFSGGGTKTATNNSGSENDIYVASDVTVSGGDVDMKGSTDGSLILDAANTTTPITYAANEEVVGKLRYSNAFGNGDLSTTTYTMNNANTSIEFTGFEVGTAPGYMEFDVQPETNPADYVAATDVNRKITINYDPNAVSDAWVANIQAWYTNTDLGVVVDETILKYYESTTPPDASEKVGGTGSAYVLNNGANTISLAGITGDAAATIDGIVDQFFADGNDLLIRANDQIFAVSDGRWSNPGTWDEFREPEPTDNVVIDGFTVHAGFVRVLVDNWTTVEASPLDLAKSLNIGSTANSSLLIGGNTGGGNDYNGTFIFQQNDVTNNATGTGYSTDLAAYTAVLVSTDRFSGILVYETTGAGATGEIRFPNLTNEGSIFNSGLIEVGN